MKSIASLNCAGIWFDSSEVDELKKVKGSENLDIGNPATGDRFDRLEGFYCPRCHARMMRILDIDQYSIWYEKCVRCQGVWLDASKFKQFKQNFKPKFGQLAKIFRPRRK